MKFSHFLVSSAALVLLAACGGGSGSSQQTETTRTIDGVASKGLLKNAIVSAYLVDASGLAASTPFITGRTNATTGAYSLAVGATTGTFLIKVTADAQTTMADEATNTTVAAPTAMVLQAVTTFSTSAGTIVTAHATPLTTMLVASAGAALTPAAISTAQSGMTAMLGFNPLTTTPVNSNTAAAATASANEQLQSVALLAISNLANNNAFGCNQTSQSARVACVVAALAAATSVTNNNLVITSAVQQALSSAFTAAASSTTNNQTGYNAAGSTGGVVTFASSTVPVTPPSAGASADLTSVKALFASLRTNLRAFYVEGDATKPLQIQADGMKADFDNATAPLDSNLTDWTYLIQRGVSLYNNYKSGASTDIYYSSYNGGCALYTDITADVLAVPASSSGSSGPTAGGSTAIPGTPPANVLSVACSTARTVATGSRVAAPTSARPNRFTDMRLSKAITMVGVAGTNNFDYSTRARKQTYEFDVVNGVSGYIALVANTNVLIGNYAPTTRADGRGVGTIAYTKDAAGEITSINVVGDMPAQYTDAGVATTDKGLWNLAISNVITPSGLNKINRMSIAGTISAVRGSQVVVSSAGIGAGSYVQLELDPQDEVVKGANSGMNLVLNASALTSAFQGTFTASGFGSDVSNTLYAPTSAQFVGKLTRGTGAAAEFFSGTFTATLTGLASYNHSLPETATNFRRLTGSFVGVVKAAGRQNISLSLSANKTSRYLSTVTGSYTDGNNTLNISGVDDQSPTAAAGASYFDISSNGISMHAPNGASSVNIVKNNTTYGTYNRNTSIITYSDGSTESLN